MRDAKEFKNTIEFASEKVHNAWMEEKLKQGFHAPNDCSRKITNAQVKRTLPKFNKHCDKCHTDLYPYSELPENIKDYDRVTVIAVLNAVNYFENKTCSDCGYLRNGVCFGYEQEFAYSDDNPICETFAPRGLVEESL